MSHFPGARMVRLQASSDDLSTASTFTWYDVNTQATITPVAGMILVIYALSVANGATSVTVTVFDDNDGDGTVDAGEAIFQKVMAVNELAGFALVRGFSIPVTGSGSTIRVPKVKASAGSVGTNVFIYGELLENAPQITTRSNV